MCCLRRLSLIMHYSCVVLELPLFGHISMPSACAFDLVLLIYLFFSCVFIWGISFFNYPFFACAFDLVLCFTLCFLCVFIWCFVMKLCIMCVCIGQWFKSSTTEGKGVSSNLVVCVSTFLHTRLSLGIIPLPAVWPNLWGMSRVLPSPAIAHYAL